MVDFISSPWYHGGTAIRLHNVKARCQSIKKLGFLSFCKPVLVPCSLSKIVLFKRKQIEKSFISIVHSILESSKQTWLIQNIIPALLTFDSLMGISSNILAATKELCTLYQLLLLLYLDEMCDWIGRWRTECGNIMGVPQTKNIQSQKKN